MRGGRANSSRTVCGGVRTARGRCAKACGQLVDDARRMRRQLADSTETVQTACEQCGGTQTTCEQCGGARMTGGGRADGEWTANGR